MRLITLLFGHPGGVLGRPCVFCNALDSFWAAVGNTLVFVDSDDCWKPSAPKAQIFVLGALFCIGVSFWAAVKEQKTLDFSRKRKLLETQRPESEDIGNLAGVCEFMISMMCPRKPPTSRFGCLLGLLGTSWRRLGASWGRLGASLGGRPGRSSA